MLLILRSSVCICYQDNLDGYTQLIRFTDNEDYLEMKEDLENLIRLGIQIESITTDGHKSILKAIKSAVPEAKVQRCLVHIQRMCLLWLTRYPKHIAGQELRSIVLMLLKFNLKTTKPFGFKSLIPGTLGINFISAKKQLMRKQADIGILIN